MVSLDWLYHIMQYGYQDGSEQQFLVNRKITFCDLELDKHQTKFLLTDTTPLSKVFDEYAHQRDMYPSQYGFLLDGKRLDCSETPQTLGLKGGIQIKVVPVEKLKISIRAMEGQETLYAVKNTMRLSTAFDNYAKMNDVDTSQYDFLLDSKRVGNYDLTPWALEMKNGSIIDAFQKVTIDLRCSITMRNFITDTVQHFRLRETKPISNVFDLYAHMNGIEVSQCEFILCGKFIDDYSATPQMLDLSKNNTIIVCVKNDNDSMEE